MLYGGWHLLGEYHQREWHVGIAAVTSNREDGCGGPMLDRRFAHPAYTARSTCAAAGDYATVACGDNADPADSLQCLCGSLARHGRKAEHDADRVIGRLGGATHRARIDVSTAGGWGADIGTTPSETGARGYSRWPTGADYVLCK